MNYTSSQNPNPTAPQYKHVGKGQIPRGGPKYTLAFKPLAPKRLVDETERDAPEFCGVPTLLFAERELCESFPLVANPPSPGYR